MKNNEALSVLADITGLSDLAFDKNNTCDLLIDGKMEVYLVGDPESSMLRLNAILGNAIAIGADPELLLEVNYRADETGGGALAINRQTGDLVYVKTLDLTGANPGSLSDSVQQALKYAAFWNETVHDLKRASRRETASSSDAEMIIRA